MLDWFRSRAIRLLFHFIDTAREAPLDDKIEEWLADNWGHPGFRSYISQRDFLLVRKLAGGDQLTAPEHRKVWQMSGQRVELLLLGQKAHQAYKRREDRRKQPITRRSR